MTQSSPIVSRLPGRLRLRDDALRRPGHNRAVCETLEGWAGVGAVAGNPATGSVLLHYDAAHVPQAEMEARVLALLIPPQSAAPDADDDDEALLQASGGAAALWRLNRYAKWGMLASLGGSLLALGVGKKMHAALGALHVGLLLVHLANHRGRLVD